jgi:hypothetical protein
MSRTTRPRRLALTAALSGAALAAAALTPAATSAAAARPAGHNAKPGVVGLPLVLDNHVQLDGYDEATDAAGNAYIGWIANSSQVNAGSRTVYLCTLHPSGSACAGGIQHTASLGISSAEGLKVIVTPAGHVTLVWFHDDIASENGPDGSSIAEATSDRGGALSAPSDVVTNAPSFGSMLDAVAGPDGKIWTITYADLTGPLQLRDGFTSSAAHVTPPWGVGFAQLAFSKNTPVLSVEKDGAITTGPSYATASGSHWSSFKPVARTWAVGTDADLTATHHGLRLITSVNNASYHPAISKWTGTGFSPRQPTADNSNCTPVGHDADTDASGRLVDITTECDKKLAIADFPNDNQAAILSIPTKGLPAGGTAQIATTSRGIGYVAWSVEAGSTGDLLRVERVLLPDRTTSKSKHGSAGKVTVFGPMSCLPAVSTPVRVKAHHAHGWTVSSTSLRLGKKRLHKSINGSTLKAGKTYKLKGSAVFASGSHHKKITATLKFRSCPTG